MIIGHNQFKQQVQETTYTMEIVLGEQLYIAPTLYQLMAKVIEDGWHIVPDALMIDYSTNILSRGVFEKLLRRGKVCSIDVAGKTYTGADPYQVMTAMEADKIYVVPDAADHFIYAQAIQLKTYMPYEKALQNLIRRTSRDNVPVTRISFWTPEDEEYYAVVIEDDDE